MSEDPYRAYNFKLEIAGVTQGHFTEVRGLGAKVQAIPYREAGNNQVVHYVPGQPEYFCLELCFGFTATWEIFDLFMNAAQGQVKRQNVSVVLLGPDGSTEVARWNLIDAWPCEWQGAPLDALGNEIAVEKVKFCYDSLERA
jgi:phage tail-like protein